MKQQAGKDIAAEAAAAAGCSCRRTQGKPPAKQEHYHVKSAHCQYLQQAKHPHCVAAFT